MNSKIPELEIIKKLLEQGGYAEEAIREVLKWYGYLEEG